MNDQQTDAVNRLAEILSEVRDLGAEAEQLVRDFFPAEHSWCEAYGVFQFGTSGNPYDNTMEKLLENIDQQESEGTYDEEESPD